MGSGPKSSKLLFSPVVGPRAQKCIQSRFVVSLAPRDPFGALLTDRFQYFRISWTPFHIFGIKLFSYQKVFYDFMRPWGPFGYPLCLMQGSCSFLSVQLVLQGGPGVRLSVFGGVFGSPLASPGDQESWLHMVLLEQVRANVLLRLILSSDCWASTSACFCIRGHVTTFWPSLRWGTFLKRPYVTSRNLLFVSVMSHDCYVFLGISVLRSKLLRNKLLLIV